jgi:hypothetical protein
MIGDPQAILTAASRGAAAPGWAVFTKKRGRVSGFLRGTSDDPDPILVVTSEGVVEYADKRKGIQLVDFDHLAEATLRIRGHSFSDSMFVTLYVWLDLRFRDGRTSEWRSASFADDFRTIQSALEAYGAYKALRGRS